MALDRTQMRGQVGGEGVRPAIAEKKSEAGDTVPVRRQPVRLSVVDHLQTMLDPAQKSVVLDQRRRGRRIDAPGSGKPPQRLASRADAQLRHPPAPDQLLRLSKEFDLANAAAANLDIVVFDGDPAAAAIRVDLTLDRMDILDRRKI